MSSPSSPSQASSPTSNSQPQPTQQHYIGAFEAAPHFMRDNPSIQTGYRINFNTPRKVLKSLFMLHNETMNIWTHCLPALLLITLTLSLLIAAHDSSQVSSMHSLQQELTQRLTRYHVALLNATQQGDISEQAHLSQSQQPSLLPSQIQHQYVEIIANTTKQTEGLMESLQRRLEGLQYSIGQEVKNRLEELERVKREFQQEMAPYIVSEVKNSINGTFLAKLGNHLVTLRKHIDSDLFHSMDLHEDTPNPQQISKWPLFVFLFSAVLCLLFSTVFHLFHPLSMKTYGLLLRFDFAGISLLVAGSAFPCFYYSMYCQMDVATIYLTFSITAAIACFVICLFEWIHRIGNQVYRSVVFGIFGTSHVVPLSHLVINEVVYDNYGDPFKFSSSIIYYLLLIASYGLGLIIFTLKCPQRKNPGRYDICGHSHQIWHIAVVLGIIFTYYGLLQNYEMRKMSVCPI